MSESQDIPAPRDCGGDAAAYVLGALDQAEAEAFCRHLEECAVCGDDVDALGGVAHALPMSAPQFPPPPRARRRLMRAVREEPKAAARRQGPSRAGHWMSRPAAALASAAVVAAAVIGVVELSGGGTASRLIQARVTGFSGAAELRLAGGRGELIVSHLSPPPPGHVYEVWLKSPTGLTQPASVLFSVGSSGEADVGLPENLSAVSQVMVTPEPDGGSPAPTHRAVIVADLT